MVLHSSLVCGQKVLIKHNNNNYNSTVCTINKITPKGFHAGSQIIYEKTRGDVFLLDEKSLHRWKDAAEEIKALRIIINDILDNLEPVTFK